MFIVIHQVKTNGKKIDTSSPYGLVGHAGVSISTNKAIILGGVNKQIFDKYFINLNHAKTIHLLKVKLLMITLINP